MRDLELRAALTDLLSAERESANSGSNARKEAEIEKLMELAVRSGYTPPSFEVNREFEQSALERVRQAAARQREVAEPTRTNGQAARGWLNGVFNGSDSHKGGRWRVWIGGLGLATAAALLVLYFLSQVGPQTGRQAPLVKEVPRKVQPTPDSANPDLKPDIGPRKEPQVIIQRVPGPPRSNEPGRTTPSDEPWKKETYVAQRVDVGRFTAVMGEPKVRRIGSPDAGHALPNQSLVAGVVIETGDADKAEIQFNDGSVVRMGFNAIVAFDYFPSGSAAFESMPRPSGIRQLRGSVEYVVAPQRPDNLFAVVTPAATATALGTEFRVLVRKPGATSESVPARKEVLETLLQVKSGSVEFANRHGRVTVPSSFESLVRGMGRPGEPRRILAHRIVSLTTGLSHIHYNRHPSPLDMAQSLVDVTGHSGLDVEDVPIGWPDFNSPSAFASGSSGQPKESEGESQTRVQVVHVMPRSPGDRAGIREGDVVVAAKGEPVRSARQAYQTVFPKRGNRVTLSLERNGNRFSVSLTLADVWNYLPRPSVPGKELALLEPVTRLLLRGDTETAAKRLRRMVEREPTAAAHNNLGVAYHWQDRMGLAVRHSSEAVRLAPNEPFYRDNLVNSLIEIGNLERALEEARELVRIAPKAYGAWLHLSNAYHHLGDDENALTAAKQAAKLAPELDRTWVVLAIAHSYLLQFDLVLAATQEALRRHPLCGHAFYFLGSMAYDRGDFRSAERHLSRALELNPNDVPALKDFSFLLSESGRFREARAYAERGVRLNPHDTELFLRLAFCLAKLGDTAAGETMVRRAIALDPNSALGYHVLGQVLSRPGINSEALSAFSEALAIDPNFKPALSHVGTLLVQQGRLEEALPHFLKWRELDPEDPHPYSWLSDSLTRLKRFAEAEKIDREWIRLAPKHSIPYRQLALALVEQNATSEEALAMALKSVELSALVEDEPQRGFSFGTLGLVYLRRGELDSAESWIRKALAIGEVASYWRNLGRTLELKSKRGEAIEAYKKALALNPNDKDAKEGLERLIGQGSPPPKPVL